ncbi:hypothetical protein FIBSPDRAFT_868364 [Athelia psychrophila]|uniref:Uncharacterized protein n=1 Tax=Athelia psychrophila TaxID=1759441 RepID=A0A166D767_9AGAM|nr:hypothetical protein FIBSPDRAFT_868364 [Fibularhizoctonia sp. CBS 109695]
MFKAKLDHAIMLKRLLDDSNRVAEYGMNLIDIDSDTLNVRNANLRIEVSKDGVRFVSDGEGANGSC